MNSPELVKFKKLIIQVQKNDYFSNFLELKNKYDSFESVFYQIKKNMLFYGALKNKF